MADAHPFAPSEDDEHYCGHPVKTANGTWGGQTCGLPASNARAHPPGMKAPAPTPERHLTAVPSITEPTVFLRRDAGDPEVQAAKTAKLRRGTLRRSVMETMYHPSRRDGGRTFDEIKRDLRMPDRHSSITSAVRSLVVDGLAQALTDDEDNPVTRLSDSGVPSTAWVLTSAGLTACAAHDKEASAS